MDGFLNIFKPTGLTSHDVVAQLRKAISIRRIGHAGTLDPDASGVLLIAVNRATRLLSYLRLEPKIYAARLALGRATTTQDASGETTEEADASGVTAERLKEALAPFIGALRQIPPMYSALHHDGQRLYALARRGMEVERSPRNVTVFRMNLTAFRPGTYAEADILIECSGGTYVRTLCHDIGSALGVGGHLGGLVRAAVGPYTEETAMPLTNVRGPEDAQENLIPMIDALWPEGGPVVLVSQQDRARTLNGGSLSTEVQADAAIPPRPIPMVCDRELLAFAEIHSNRAQPMIVFNPPVAVGR